MNSNKKKSTLAELQIKNGTKFPGRAALIQLIESNKGNKTLIARACNVTRATLYSWMDADPTLYEICNAAYKLGIDEALDKAEAAIDRFISGIPQLNSKGRQIGWILRPEYQCAMFKLKTQGKSRGYVERMEQVAVQTQMPTFTVQYQSKDDVEHTEKG